MQNFLKIKIKLKMIMIIKRIYLYDFHSNAQFSLISRSRSVGVLVQSRYFSFARPSLDSNSLDKGPFYNIIPSTYISSNNKAISVFFYIHEIYDDTVFNDTVISVVSKGFVYTVFIKVRYNKDDFFMAGNQFGFDFRVDDDVEEHVRDTVTQRVDEYLDVYKLTPKDIVYVQVSFRQKIII